MVLTMSGDDRYMPAAGRGGTPPDRGVLQFERVCFVRAGRRIINDISWTLPVRGIGAILGPNGSGKSTLLRMATGYLWPSSGRCYFDGRCMGTFPVADMRRRIAMVEGTPILPLGPEMSTLDVICSGLFGKLTVAYDPLSDQQCRLARELAELVGLHDHLDQAYETLSTGEKMRAMLARGLIALPQLLILDECTNGLDIPSRETYLATVEEICRQSDRPAVLVVTHYPEELPRQINDILLLNRRGEIQKAGHPEMVMTSETFSAAFEWPVTISHQGGRYSARTETTAWSRHHSP